MRLEDLIAMIPCCDAMQSIKRIYGHVAQPIEGIPPDEIWVIQSRSIQRCRLDDMGRWVVTPMPLSPGAIPLPMEGANDTGSADDVGVPADA